MHSNNFGQNVAGLVNMMNSSENKLMNGVLEVVLYWAVFSSQGKSNLIDADDIPFDTDDDIPVDESTNESGDDEFEFDAEEVYEENEDEEIWSRRDSDEELFYQQKDEDESIADDAFCHLEVRQDDNYYDNEEDEENEVEDDTFSGRLSQKPPESLVPLFGKETVNGRGFCQINRSFDGIDLEGSIVKIDPKRSLEEAPTNRFGTKSFFKQLREQSEQQIEPKPREKTHFELGEEFDYECRYGALQSQHQPFLQPAEPKPSIDFSFQIDNAQLSIITDNSQISFKRVCALFDKHSITYDPQAVIHDVWFFGLQSHTFAFSEQSTQSLNSQIIKIEQNLLNQKTTFWISYRKRPMFQDKHFNLDEEHLLEQQLMHTRRNKCICSLEFKAGIEMEVCRGALVSMNTFNAYDKIIKSTRWWLRFYDDKLIMDVENDDRKIIKYQFIDKCAIFTTLSESCGFICYICMKGNWITQKRIICEPDKNPNGSKSPYYAQRTANLKPDKTFSTIRLKVQLSSWSPAKVYSRQNCRRNGHSVPDEPRKQQHVDISRIKEAYKQLLDYFYRHKITVCYGSVNYSTGADLNTYSWYKQLNFQTFIQNYCWSMLLSIGYRFEQRIVKEFLDEFKKITNDDQFYQISIHMWRRAKEYHFINLQEEFVKYKQRLIDMEPKRDGVSLKMMSCLENPPKNYAYVPSVLLTPSTVCIRPFKLCKTNRVLREQKFGGPMNFALIEVKEEDESTLFATDYRALRWKLKKYLDGISITPQRLYKWLHHSQSQLKEKQFWFYFHDPQQKNLGFKDAYAWMGNFESERVVAKHSARIAQCLTSTDATIAIPAEKVQYISDIERNGYTFTDGVGIISTELRDDIGYSIGFRHQFSVMQIRYGGCKGTIAINPELNGHDKQLVLRDSMLKFTTDHNVLELCKVSSARPLSLNRQGIVLLSNREIHDSVFIILQNEHHLWLINSLLHHADTFDVLNDKIRQLNFPFRELILEGKIDVIHEPFFRQLLTTVCKNDIQQLKKKSRSKIGKNKARNMIGIVDESSILQYGEVFVQYTIMKTDSLFDEPSRTFNSNTRVLEGPVVVTKNPCHHPGDVRTFTAVNLPQLRHLKDVIVFPQNGPRPHPNEISGSDLDGDEYAVYWHEDLIPTTENYKPYDYDQQEKPKKLDRPVTREDIRNIVLDISEHDMLGRLSNLHLAYVDAFGVTDPRSIEIAGAIAQEVDAGKTGRHPYTDEQIRKLNIELCGKRPDYVENRGGFETYTSKHVLGILYRAVLRSAPGWAKINRSLTYTTPATPNAHGIVSTHITAHIQIDPLFVHEKHHLYKKSAEELFKVYRESILDIMFVYHFSSEVDLICRFDSQQQILLKQFDIVDTAQVELKRLMEKIRNLFYEEFDNRHGNRHKTCDCSSCTYEKMAKASACYVVCYQQSYLKKILSFPWLFARLLIKIRQNKMEDLKSSTSLSQQHSLELQHYTIVGLAMKNALQSLVNSKQLSFLVTFQRINGNDVEDALVQLARTTTSKKFVQQRLKLIELCFLEVINNWLYRQQIFGEQRSLPTDKKQVILEKTWQHVLTKFVFYQQPDDGESS
ncbi:unnamed protein product, partial [Didymodactylos carnosus]